MTNKNLDHLFNLIRTPHSAELFDKIICRIASEIGEKLFAFSAIADGHTADPFAVTAIVYGGNNGPKALSLRREITASDWAEEHILPYIKDMAINVSSYDEIIRRFSDFYLTNKSYKNSVCNNFFPANNKLVADAYSKDMLWPAFVDGAWLSSDTLLHFSGISPEAYIASQGFSVPEETPANAEAYTELIPPENLNPAYKCRVAALSYLHLLYSHAQQS